jgi:DNA-binding CsgD family transcriptional regulator
MANKSRDTVASQLERDLATLSLREREVLDAALEGRSAREIAKQLMLTEATVRSHLSAIYSKLGVSGRVALLARMNSAGGQPRMIPAEPEPTAPRPRTWPRAIGRRGAVRLVVVSLAAIAAIGFVAIRPDLPPQSDLAKVSELLAKGRIARLDLVGETLTATERTGGRVRVEGVTGEAFGPLQGAAVGARIPVSVSADSFSLATTIVMIATALLPLGIAAAALWLLVISPRRPPRGKPASVG